MCRGERDLLPFNEMNAGKGSPEKALTYSLEPKRHVRYEEAVIGWCLAWIPQFHLRQRAGSLLGHGLGRVHQHNPIPHDILEQGLEKRVVGAAEHQGIDLIADDGLQVFLRRQPRNLVVKPAFLDKRNE